MDERCDNCEFFDRDEICDECLKHRRLHRKNKHPYGYEYEYECDIELYCDD